MNHFQKDQVQDIYYLSPMQEGMLFHTLLHPGQSFYMEQLSMQVKGSFRTDLLEKSLNVLMDRYDIFRTVFIHEKMKRPVQVVLKRRALEVKEIDLSDLPGELQERRIQEYAKQDKELGFDLSKDIPMRTTVFKKAEGVYEWSWSYHHILLDGWCFGIVIQELFQVYGALLHNQPYYLRPVKPYKELIQWLESQDKERALNYWGQYVSGFEGQTTFAEQRKKRSREGHDPKEKQFTLSEQLTRAFSESASVQGVTLSTALQAVWAVLLSRYQRTDDIMFGTVVSGRPAEIDGVENMVGLFINVVPTRVRVAGDSTFAQLLSAMQQQSLQSDDYQYVPLYDIQGRAQRHDLIDHIIVFENYPLQAANERQEDQGLGFAIGKTEVFEKSNYDLNLMASPGTEMALKVAYNSNVFESSFIERLQEQLVEIVRQVVLNPHLPLGDVRVIAKEEERRLLSEFNPSRSQASDRLTLPQWFERQAKQTPDLIALSSRDVMLTYAELNGRANRLARLLRTKGVKRETIVAMLVDRSPGMIIGILAILKAGGAYVPIDPEYPDQRIRYMLEDSGAALLLTERALELSVDGVSYKGSVLFIDDPSLYEGVGDGDTDQVEAAGDPDDLAYVMYTSGTTGNPKGNLTTHANISRVAKDTNYIEIRENDTLLSISNYAFDGFTFDLFGALLNGAKLVLAPKQTVLHSGKLMRLIHDERITIMFVTTALFNFLVDAGPEWMAGIRKVLFGGERSSVAHVRKALQQMGPDKIIHVYGPTETTVFATFHPVNEIAEDAAAIPIGKPLQLTGAYILGPTNQLQPIEAFGELCLSGTGLARGYLNRPELTAEKFVPHPFVPGQKLYRSGDLARWLPGGEIEIMGRIDDQVKIRGHRIELGEIEAQLLAHGGVKEAVVLALRSDAGETSLCAYVVGQSRAGLSQEQLHAHLAATLPGYMLPYQFVVLDKLPLTANGKVDRRLLPKPKQDAIGTREGAPPRNDIESRLVGMWCETLGVERIGIHDNFFAVGGHSLKAMALCAQMLKQFQIDVPVRVFFEAPTISAISAYLQGAADMPEGGRADKGQVRPELTVFNPEASRNVFAFPPVLGYGIMFNDLAQQMPEYRFHAFDFMEEGDRIRSYAAMMLDLQPEGPFALLGYSAGCALAFEIAKALEQAGRSVDALVMVDSYQKIGISDLEGRTVDQDVDALMEVNQDNPYVQEESVRDGFARKLKAYYTYYVELVNIGQVRAPIHFVQSETALPFPSWMSSWKGATASSYCALQGYGKHEEMLQGGWVQANAGLIGRILQEARSSEYVVTN